MITPVIISYHNDCNPSLSGDNKDMATKPFVAARIPEDLNAKLEEHSKTTGENRTQILVNALATYIGYSPNKEVVESAKDRLSILESKVAELEKLIKEPLQISFLDLPSHSTKDSTLKKITADNRSDNISQFQKTEPETVENLGITGNKKVLPTSEVVKLTGISRKKLEHDRDNGKLPAEKNGWSVVAFAGKHLHKGRITNFWKIAKANDQEASSTPS